MKTLITVAILCLLYVLPTHAQFPPTQTLASGPTVRLLFNGATGTLNINAFSANFTTFNIAQFIDNSVVIQLKPLTVPQATSALAALTAALKSTTTVFKVGYSADGTFEITLLPAALKAAGFVFQPAYFKINISNAAGVAVFQLSIPLAGFYAGSIIVP